MQTSLNSGNPAEWKYADVTARIIGAAMTVHRELSAGFPGYVFARAPEMEFQISALPAKAEFAPPVFYKGRRITTWRVDFFVEDKISGEIKAVGNLDNGHFVQALNYLESSNLEVGLLMNFGAPSLQFKRLLNRKFKAELNEERTNS